MANYSLDISYKGTNYFGWQIQPNKITVQGTIEAVLCKILGNKDIKLIGSGRTDAGVHAKHQIANFKLNYNLKFSLDEFKYKLNSLLPPDIKIQNVLYVSDDFNARYSARVRVYKYYIYNSNTPSPFFYDFYHFYPFKIDFKLLKKVMKYFKGTHNFKSFSNSNSDVSNFVRTVYKFDLQKKGKIVIITISANSFLYGMVRNIVGTLLQLNRLNQNPKIIENVLKKHNRIYAGEKAPAKGLVLDSVLYD